MIRKILFVLSAAMILSSCGEGTPAEVKVETKDVKGTIACGDASVGTTELHNPDGVFEVPNIKFNDDCRLTIVPTDRTFEEEWKKIESNASSFKSELSEIEKKDNAVFYKEKSEFMEKVTEGYNFLVVVKGEGKNYIMKGEGENPFAPITSKEDAEKAFAAAQSFKPE